MRSEAWTGEETVVAFDINDRGTWAWRDDIHTSEDRFDGNYGIDPDSEAHFYQRTDTGRATRLACAYGGLYNPTASPGPVCESLATTELRLQVYQWCLDRGLVTEDQR